MKEDINTGITEEADGTLATGHERSLLYFCAGRKVTKFLEKQIPPVGRNDKVSGRSRFLPSVGMTKRGEKQKALLAMGGCAGGQVAQRGQESGGTLGIVKRVESDRRGELRGLGAEADL